MDSMDNLTQLQAMKHFPKFPTLDLNFRLKVTEAEVLINIYISADSSWGTGWSYISDATLHLSLYPVIFTHTHKNVFGSTPHAFKNPSKTVKQALSVWQPLCEWGKDWTKTSVFHHTAAALEIYLRLIVLRFKVLKLHAPVAS